MQPTDWEKILTNPTSDRGLIFKVYKELKKLDTRESNNPIKNWGIDLNKNFSIEEYGMVENHVREILRTHRHSRKLPEHQWLVL